MKLEDGGEGNECNFVCGGSLRYIWDFHWRSLQEQDLGVHGPRKGLKCRYVGYLMLSEAAGVMKISQRHFKEERGQG